MEGLRIDNIAPSNSAILDLIFPAPAARWQVLRYARWMTGWVDYVIASDDPADRALLEEFRNLAWSYGQLMQFVVADPANINDETAAKMDEAQEAENELQARIAARGKALRDAGHAPADEAAFKAWRASWVPLASHIGNDGPLPRA